ncbi:hypothetical protein ABZ901_26130 [Actinacidiphila alni]|uniref:hypothetical protein n=1 Tax=Actinacidiphila alni TaxID=380248 RepID=UPI00340C9DC6
MFRTVVGSLLALIGAAGAVWSPFRAWYGGRHGSGIRVDDLFTGVGVTPDKAALLGSLFLPMGFAALLTLLGVLLRSRLALLLAGLLVLGVTVLWMVRQGQAAGSLTAGGDGLGYGVATAFGSGLLILLGAFLLHGRRRAPAYGEPVPYEEPVPYDDGRRYGEDPRSDDGRRYGSGYGGTGQHGTGDQPPMPPYDPGGPDDPGTTRTLPTIEGGTVEGGGLDGTSGPPKA